MTQLPVSRSDTTWVPIRDGQEVRTLVPSGTMDVVFPVYGVRPGRPRGKTSYVVLRTLTGRCAVHPKKVRSRPRRVRV